LRVLRLAVLNLGSAAISLPAFTAFGHVPVVSLGCDSPGVSARGIACNRKDLKEKRGEGREAQYVWVGLGSGRANFAAGS